MGDRKVAVVTGSSSGIGAATAMHFARNGYNVVVNYVRNSEAASKVAKECEEFGVESLVVQADVAREADCQALAGMVQKRWGRTDALVNSAGTTKFISASDLDKVSAEDFLTIYSVNVIGAFQMSRALVRMLSASPDAAIVNVSSIASITGLGSSIPYMASKGALNAMTFALARSLAPNVRVNAVGPGLVQTPWMEEGLGQERYSRYCNSYSNSSPLRSAILPEDVADACYWLCTGARRTTGEFILVDSGFAKFSNQPIA